MELSIESIKPVVDRYIFRDWLVLNGFGRCHSFWRSLKVGVATGSFSCKDRSRNRRSQGASLTRTRDLHSATCDVCVYLHEQRIFLSHAPAADHALDRNAVLPDALDDDASA